MKKWNMLHYLVAFCRDFFRVSSDLWQQHGKIIHHSIMTIITNYDYYSQLTKGINGRGDNGCKGKEEQGVQRNSGKWGTVVTEELKYIGTESIERNSEQGGMFSGERG